MLEKKKTLISFPGEGNFPLAPLYVRPEQLDHSLVRLKERIISAPLD